MASDVGLDVFRGRATGRSPRPDLKAAGYMARRWCCWFPPTRRRQKPLGDVAADMLQQCGINVDYAGMEFGAVLQRQLKKDPIARVDGAPVSAIGRDRLAQSGRQHAICARWQGRRLVQQREDGRCCAASGSRPQSCEQNNASAVIFRRCRSRSPLIFRSAQYEQPTAYRTNVTGILAARPSSWMCARHEHDRDLAS